MKISRKKKKKQKISYDIWIKRFVCPLKSSLIKKKTKKYKKPTNQSQKLEFAKRRPETRNHAFDLLLLFNLHSHQMREKRKKNAWRVWMQFLTTVNRKLEISILFDLLFEIQIMSLIKYRQNWKERINEPNATNIIILKPNLARRRINIKIIASLYYIRKNNIRECRGKIHAIRNYSVGLLDDTVFTVSNAR